MKVSYRVPVHIRAKYDNTYRCVWKKMYSSSPSMLAEWIASCSESDSQGVNLIAVLEITLVFHGFKGCRQRLTEVQSLDVKLKSLRHASTDQLSNFLATSIEILARLGETDDEKATRNDGLAIMRKIWLWSRRKRFWQILEPLFEQTIKKLETNAIPLCLWFFLTILRSLLIEMSMVLSNHLEIAPDRKLRLHDRLQVTVRHHAQITFRQRENVLRFNLVAFRDVDHAVLASPREFRVLWRSALCHAGFLRGG